MLNTHPGVACDGCGVHPIIGIRYKCSVCKNFDYCEVCEDRQAHDHPFIKIVKPENAPTAIITAVNEDEECQSMREHIHNHHHHPHSHGDEAHHRGHRHFGRGGRGRACWRQFANATVDMITRNIMKTSPQDECEGTQTEDPEMSGAYCEKQRSKWSEQRAIIVSKPMEPVVAEIGQVVFASLEILNNTKWPWKHGCIFTTSPKQNAAL